MNSQILQSNYTAILGLGLFFFITLQIIKLIVLRILKNKLNQDIFEKKKESVKSNFMVMSVIIAALTFIGIVFISLFGINRNPGEPVTIPTAPLKQVSSEASEGKTDKSEIIDKQAQEANNKAMKEGINLFRQAK